MAADAEEDIPLLVRKEPDEKKVIRFFVRRRDFIGFWILGTCNNFLYTMMLSGAYDILDKDDIKANVTLKASAPRKCLKHGTYQILLADICPSVIVSLIIPHLAHLIPYWTRVVTVILCMTASLLLVALSSTLSIILLGVGLTSIASGLGELSFLALASNYESGALSGWSTGTGTAGVVSAAMYLGLSSFLSIKITILVPLFVPVLVAIAYFFIIGRPIQREVSSESVLINSVSNEEERPKPSDLRGKLRRICTQTKILPHLFTHYISWLLLVYISQYTINQSLHESLYYPNTHIGGYYLTQNKQYIWYQFVQSFGVFLLRASLPLFKIKYFCVLSVIEALLFLFLFNEAVYQFVPYFWITLCVILIEGMLEGGVYGNTFHFISKNVDPKYREFSMSVSTLGINVGISVGAVVAMVVHNYICSLGY